MLHCHAERKNETRIVRKDLLSYGGHIQKYWLVLFSLLYFLLCALLAITCTFSFDFGKKTKLLYNYWPNNKKQSEKTHGLTMKQLTFAGRNRKLKGNSCELHLFSGFFGQCRLVRWLALQFSLQFSLVQFSSETKCNAITTICAIVTGGNL